MSIAKRLVFSVVANTTRAIISFATGMIVARSLGPEQYGVFSFLLASFAAMMSLLDMGSSSAFFTFISKRIRSQKFFMYYAYWLLLQFSIFVIIILVITPDAWLHIIWQGESKELIIIAFISVFFQPSGIRITFVLIGLVCIYTFVSGVTWFIEFRSSKSLGEKINWAASKKMILYGLPIVPGLYFNYLSNWGDHILLQHFKSTEDVGLFSADFQAMAALTGLASSISILLLAKLIDKKITDSEAERDYIIRIVPTILSLWLMMIIPILTIIPWFFMIVFGSEFSDAIPALLILCGAVPCSIFTSVYVVLFETQGRLGRSSLFSGIMFFVNMVISFALVVEFGTVGVAIGTMVSYFIYQYLYVIDQHMFLKVPKYKAITLLIFSVFYGLIQIAVGDEMAFRIGGALLSFSCLILIIRHYKMVDKAILEHLLSGKLSSFHPHFHRILIRH